MQKIQNALDAFSLPPLFPKPLVKISLYHFALKSSKHLFVSLIGCKTTLRAIFFPSLQSKALAP